MKKSKGSKVMFTQTLLTRAKQNQAHIRPALVGEPGDLPNIFLLPGNLSRFLGDICSISNLCEKDGIACSREELSLVSHLHC